MTLLEHLHGGYIQQKRLDGLVRHLIDVMPKNASVLDVGCGDGRLAALLREKRPDLVVEGIEVLRRDKTWIPVRQFDGQTIPYKSASLDVVMFIDVLHHVDDPMSLLREAARVARKSVVIKDHLNDGWFAESTLRFMDRIGNARYGVALPGNYWRLNQWERAFRALALTPVEWREELGLYPKILDLWFGRTLHFVAKLEAA
ncbi:MAG TPA: methyltransferase domain-containing protein [Nitrospiraceae bacterium]|nr:methyltransferase domain-containing protein [Nitrospiraceae bacterium]